MALPQGSYRGMNVKGPATLLLGWRDVKGPKLISVARCLANSLGLNWLGAVMNYSYLFPAS